jgi:hypothetical protein
MIFGCVFAGNVAQTGGGLLNWSDGRTEILRCTLYGNRADTGSAICTRLSAPNELSAGCSIVAFNVGGECAVSGTDSNTVELWCSNVYGNLGGDYVCAVEGQLENMNGNLSEDPLFCDTANGDYSIREISVCAPANNSCGQAGVLIGALGVGCSSTDVDDPAGDDALPDRHTLSQNYPNPFNPQTNIEFYLSRASDVTIEIYNVMGQKVRGLVSERLSAGQKLVTWDGKDKNGAAVSSGVYFYRITAEDFEETRKMVLLK